MSMPPANPYENPSMPTSGNSYTVGRRTIKTLKRIEPLSVAKIQGALMALLGLIGAAVFILMAIAGAAIRPPGNQAVAGIVGMLIGAIFVPIIYGMIGFIGGLIGALVYNLCASLMGGIEMEFEE